MPSDTVSTVPQFFGHAVAIVGDVNNDGYDDFVVGRECCEVTVHSGLDATIIHTLENPAGPSVLHFGASVSGAGDVNNDGYDDIIVGSPETKEAFVFSGVDGTVIHSFFVASSYFGFAVAGPGDLNGDGYADIVVSDCWFKVRVYSGINGALLYTWTGTFGNLFGYSVSGAGDVDGDNVPDVIVGEPGYDVGVADTLHVGRAHIYSGNGGLLATLDGPIWIASSWNGHSYFGHSVSGAGDVNGDGYDDVIVGRPNFGPHTNQSHCYIYENLIDDGEQMGAGQAIIYSGLTYSVLHTLNGSAYQQFGISVSGAGDVNNDGYDDVVVGAPGISDVFQTLLATGHVFVFDGFAGGLMRTFDQTGEWRDEFGISVSGGGDLDGDGTPDIVVGASWAPSTNTGPDWGNGEVYLFKSEQSITTTFPSSPAQTVSVNEGACLTEYVIERRNNTAVAEGMFLYFNLPVSCLCGGVIPPTSITLFPRSGSGPVFPVNATNRSTYFLMDNLTSTGFYDLAVNCGGLIDTVQVNVEYKGYQGYTPSGVLYNSLTGNVIRGGKGEHLAGCWRWQFSVV